MALAIAEKTKKSVSSGGDPTTDAVTTTAGSLIVLFLEYDAGTFISIADSKSCTWTQIGTEQTFHSAYGATRMYYNNGGSRGASHTFTLTTSGAYANIYMVEITGQATSDVLDQANRQADTASPFTSPVITTTVANTCLVSGLAGNSGSNPAEHAESTGFTIQVEETNGPIYWVGALGTRIVSSATDYNSSWTEYNSTSTAVWIAAFKEAASDSTPPTLSSPTGTKTGSTTGSGSVSTDEGNGTLYWVVTTSATAPSVAQVQAGQDHTGAAAADSGSQAVSGTGVQNVSGGFTGLSPSTTYYAHYQHQDAATNDSTVATSSSFTTDAAYSPPVLPFVTIRLESAL